MINMTSRRQNGFSLLEILVAFSILALSLGVLLNIFSTGLRSAIISDEYIHAVAIAESLLASTGVETPLEEGETFGDAQGKYAWTVAIEAYTNDMIDQEQLAVAAYKITVEVNWQEMHDKRSVVLTTLRLASRS